MSRATVATWDPADGSGTLIADDGTRLGFDGAAFAAGGARLLRSGQRVYVERSGDQVVRIAILPLARLHPAEQS